MMLNFLIVVCGALAIGVLMESSANAAKVLLAGGGALLAIAMIVALLADLNVKNMLALYYTWRDDGWGVIQLISGGYAFILGSLIVTAKVAYHRSRSARRNDI